MIRIMPCRICNKPKKENLLLFGSNICAECEGRLVKAEADDTSYHIYMDGIKRILAGSEIEKPVG